ncbi:MAG: hypothetical protein ACHRHE_04725 [Tepidisphaerales bacterium]
MNLATLNVFQRLARQWDVIHPYNAAQILKIQGAPDADLWQNAWHDALNDLGLGRIHFEGRRYHFECLNGEMSHYGVRVLEQGSQNLEEFISEQLNRRFDNPSEPPFRPFILVENGYYYAGVVYSHWVADSVSIRVVLREWFVRVFDAAMASRTPVRLASGGYRRFFGAGGGAAIGHGLMTAAHWASMLRRARRVEVRRGYDCSVRWTMRYTPEDWVFALLAAARRRGATLNDLFMAGLAGVCERHLPLQHRRHRKSLVLGAIVDLRQYVDSSAADAFGLFLGFTNVVCRSAELLDPERLVKSIALQNAQHKRRGIAQASAFRMLAGVLTGALMRADNQPHFYQKHVPISGGVSNVNMNRSWATEYHPRPLLDYIRVSPTGPSMPLVFATTTLGNQMHFGITYRPSIVSPESVDPMARTFVDFLGGFC